MRTDSRVKQTEIYEHQQRRLTSLTTEAEVEAEVQRFARLGKQLRAVLDPAQEDDPDVRRRLQRLRDWGTTTVYPLALHQLDLRERGETDSAAVAQALLVVESFLVRRLLIGRATANINRVLFDVVPSLDKDLPVDEAVHRNLSTGLAIEHVLPQSPTAAWLDVLAEEVEDDEEPEDLHERLVHTLGNLTLTGYNSTLSNGPLRDEAGHAGGHPARTEPGSWASGARVRDVRSHDPLSFLDHTTARRVQLKITQGLLKLNQLAGDPVEDGRSRHGPALLVEAVRPLQVLVDLEHLIVESVVVSVEPTHALNALLSILKSIFRPASPTDDPELFKGREQELSRVLGTVQELGQHAVIYGERGVGKTSLAYMARDGFTEGNPQALAVRLPCSADDDFTTTWKKLIPRLTKELDVWEDTDRRRVAEAADKAEDILDFNEVSPDTVVRALNVISNRVPLLVVIDEFDRLGEPAKTEPFADVIKMASDDLMPATLLIVGVADDVASLIAGHRSIERSMRQIYMPRMSRDELSRIVVDGFATFSRRSRYELSVDLDVVDAIVHLSQGFPYYTHLLAGAVGELAIRRSARSVDRGTVFDALFTAVEEATQSIRVSYTDAVASPKQNAQFADTLLACALARVDELGFFAPADVAAPLSSLMSVPRSTPDFLHHLKRFAGPPSWILETRGEGRRARYRFHNPLMKPFVLMKGVRDERLTLEQAST